MIIQIDIPDDSPELEELQYVVAQINVERRKDAQNAGHGPPSLMTVQEYLTRLALAPLRERARKVYERHVRKMSDSELKNKLGPIKDLRS